jgi:RNA polymerase sigma factor for flagellar operon FliA
VDVDDLVHIGVLGLIDAVERFDPSKGTSFATYARIRVQGAIVDAMRQSDFVPRSVRQRARRLADARGRLQDELGRAPVAGEVARELGVDTDRVEAMDRSSQLMIVVSMDEAHTEGGDRLGDSLSTNEQGPGDLAESSDERDQLRAAIDRLGDRDRAIIKMYWFEELSFKEIGVVLGVTESRVRQLHTRARARLKDLVAG